MKHLKTYEIDKNINDIGASVCYYFESIIPITEDEGFMECSFDYDYNTNEIKNTNDMEIAFYFRKWTEIDVIENKFYKFLDDMNLELSTTKINNSNEEYNIIIDIETAKKYAELYDNTQKYNL